jgi:hypothetical protein
MSWDRAGGDRLAGRTRERHGIDRGEALRQLHEWQRSGDVARH